ncbi:SDR family NAD(P)-dependent oxidoreductase [Gilvimarinus sp. SDUM040013]|uniref:SDR family NAD(P)-dependent oxidoreductase n=1 Tax=Gilvimarinus gilvus TaxID=3058038 RepID=A0ABU4RWA3_9GAMM|nr:SDR family NAD(P)-dependent oxidoreductase [Gilvimarinus sp. SDUM040013]MDO3388587.1 SDR family NAD(P)-dependent oxidoreductase [Gilvimarinus sp. SDUM040013]MDX6848541.1 SDR family NAD(P)-dependent oxidoreductase [Gilvimarinus sp. SDUM040013]
MSKAILITGATDGIGLLTAQKLAALGHSLLIHGRSETMLNAAAKTLRECGAVSISTYRADFSDLAEVAAMVQQIKSQSVAPDVIINNAGVYKIAQPLNASGQDVRFVVNTLAPYLLTTSLLPLMPPGGRVINLSSAAQAPVDLQALAGKKILNDDFAAYAQSKLALTMWSRQLGLELKSKGPAVIAVNPGSLLASKMVKEGFGVAGNDLNIGADILLKAALNPEFAQASGLYFDNDKGTFADPHPDALDEVKGGKVMRELNRLINIE